MREADLDRAEAHIDQTLRVVIPLLVRAELSPCCINRNAVARCAQDLVNRHIGFLANDVPAGVLDNPRARCNTCNIAELEHDLFNIAGIIADDEKLHIFHRITYDRKNSVRRLHARVAGNPFIRVDSGNKNNLPFFRLSRIPCWVKWLRIRNFYAIIGNVCNFHTYRPSLSILYK